MKTTSTRVVLLVATAAVAPLVLYGYVSINSLREATRQSVTNGNQTIAARAAAEIDLYVINGVKILQASAADLRQTRLESWQQDRILKNYVLQFPEFREITLFDRQGRAVATSRVARTELAPPAAADRINSEFQIAPVTVDDDLLPRTTITIPVLDVVTGVDGWLVGDVRLEQLWQTVDQIRIGDRGFALVLADDGRLIAHGHPDRKRQIARGANLAGHPLLRQMSGNTAGALEFTNDAGDNVLAVAARVSRLGWTLIVEQPTEEAYAVAHRLGRQLSVAIGLALCVTILVGFAWGRSLLRPIAALIRGTRAISEGRLDERVVIDGPNEFRELGDAFNRMSDRLVELQQDVRRQERQAMFGRIAVGLVHDLSHPIKNIGNSCKLILKMYEDPEYRDTFKRTVNREMMALKRVLEDLRHLARPMPLERFPVDLNRAVGDVVESMRPLAESAGLTVDTELAREPLFIEGDLFALGRVYRNLVINAIQATAPGGNITVSVERLDGRVRVMVEDTGCGIPPDRLPRIFEDYMTTKKRGLGLGLAISKKIVEQLGGTIAVTSEVGKGTAFAVEFPTAAAQPMAPAAAAS
jgi:signal transduction histidine kinase